MKEFRQDALRETGAFFVAHKPFIHRPAQSRGKKKDPFFELKQKVIVCIFKDEKFVQK